MDILILQADYGDAPLSLLSEILIIADGVFANLIAKN